MKALRQKYDWSQEKLGVAIGIYESSSRARISRYELGIHEPPLPTARLIAHDLGVPLTYLYCEDDKVAVLLFALHRLSAEERNRMVHEFMQQLITKWQMENQLPGQTARTKRQNRTSTELGDPYNVVLTL